MARLALHDEAAERADERFPDSDAYWRNWCYRAAYEALERRLRQAVYRRVLVRGGEDEASYWRMVRKVANEKLQELKQV